MCNAHADVRLGPIADMCSAQIHVRQREQLETICRISDLKGFVNCESGLIPAVESLCGLAITDRVSGVAFQKNQ